MAITAALRRTPRFLPLLSRPLCTQPNPYTPTPTPKPEPHSLTRLRSAIRSQSDPALIADLFQSSTHLPGFHADRPLYSLAVHKLTRLRRLDLADQILRSQASDPDYPKSEGFLTRLLSLYSSSDMLDRADQLFDEIPQPTQLSFSALLSALLDHRRYDDVIDKFNTLPSARGIREVGTVPYSIYLRALCAKGRVGDARVVLDEMTQRGLAPDIVCYNALLDGYLKAGDEVGFHDILKMISDRGLEPNVYTYNMRISRLCRNSKSFQAEELLDVMVSKGLQPNVASFNQIIDGFCKEGDVQSAVRVFKRMRIMKRQKGKEGASPNADSYVMLIRSLVEKGEFGLGLEICRECLVRKFAPPFEVVKWLVEGLVKNDKVEEAKGIIEKMNTVVRGEAVDAWKKVESELARIEMV